MSKNRQSVQKHYTLYFYDKNLTISYYINNMCQ